MNTAKLSEFQQRARERFEDKAPEFKHNLEAIGKDRERQEAGPRYQTRQELVPDRDGLALERILGKNNLFHVNYFEHAVRAIRSVGRIHILDSSGIPAGYGTGFLVADSLLLTNNHVLETEVGARRSFVEFDYEYGPDYRPRKTSYFQLEPDRLFYTDAELDFTFVWVSPTNAENVSLSQFGLLPLIADSGKAIIGEPVTIIQHPQGGLKQVALRDSKILGIPNPPGDAFIHYSTDTDRGSSGSPVLNDQWQVVALHHAGVPDGSGGWMANEGVRVSRIIQRLQQSRNEPARRILGLLQAAPVTPITDGTGNGVRIGTASAVAAGLAEARSFTRGRWSEVDGYSATFLGDDAHVPIPRPLNSDDVTRPEEGQIELKYNHFSVIMSKSRRLAYVAAVNIDGSELRDVERVDNWRLDPRIAAELQIDNRCYRHNELDRGHLVRRKSAGWGPNAETAEADTFHYTNCAPQHRGLNQRTWVDLEDYILSTVRDRGIRASVFTGPVFMSNDRVYRDEYLIPAEFWKVAVAVEDGRLVSAGYLQTQKNLLDDLEEAFGKYKTYRVPVRVIQELTGVDFGPLVTADATSQLEAARSSAEVRGPADIRFLSDTGGGRSTDGTSQPTWQSVN